MAETCEYGEFQQQMLRDRLVVRMRDTALSERLQMNPDLTLDKVKRELRQKEAIIIIIIIVIIIIIIITAFQYRNNRHNGDK